MIGYKEESTTASVRTMYKTHLDEVGCARCRWRKGKTEREVLEIINKLYFVERKSLNEIAAKLGTERNNIRHMMMRNNLDRRSVSDAKRGNGHINSEGYVVMKFNQKAKKMHRVVWEQHNGTIPAGHHIHHVDGNKTNNDISNLELISASKHSSLHNARRKHG